MNQDYRPNIRRVTSEKSDNLSSAEGILFALAVSSILWLILAAALCSDEIIAVLRGW